MLPQNRWRFLALRELPRGACQRFKHNGDLGQAMLKHIVTERDSSAEPEVCHVSSRVCVMPSLHMRTPRRPLTRCGSMFLNFLILRNSGFSNSSARWLVIVALGKAVVNASQVVSSVIFLGSLMWGKSSSGCKAEAWPQRYRQKASYGLAPSNVKPNAYLMIMVSHRRENLSKSATVLKTSFGGQGVPSWSRGQKGIAKCSNPSPGENSVSPVCLAATT